ncbi:MAG: L,D-transpeptidase [Candidatus Eisenbacteria bacterium]
MRRRRWIILIGPAAGVSLAAAGAFHLIPPLLDRTHPPEAARTAAEESRRRARADESGRWASADFERAGVLLDEGLTEFRRQEIRLLPFRDFTAAESLFAASIEAFDGAREQAGSLRLDLRARTTSDINRAEALVSTVSTFADHIHLAAQDRNRLRECRDSLARARLSWEGDDFPEASRLARKAADIAKDLGDRCAARADRYADKSLLVEWSSAAQAAIEWSRRTGKPAIVVTKASHRLTLYRSGKASKTYAVDIGYNNTADKTRAGDGATPEGKYTVVQKKSKGQSRYYKALLLDYPNEEDRRRFQEARRAGRLESGATPGSLIEIHGDGGRRTDWTKGCIALQNDEMDHVFDAVSVGTPVTIIGSNGHGDRFAPFVTRFRSIRGAGR